MSWAAPTRVESRLTPVASIPAVFAMRRKIAIAPDGRRPPGLGHGVDEAGHGIGGGREGGQASAHQAVKTTVSARIARSVFGASAPRASARSRSRQ
jgi:hypothetical protein